MIYLIRSCWKLDVVIKSLIISTRLEHVSLSLGRERIIRFVFIHASGEALIKRIRAALNGVG